MKLEIDFLESIATDIRREANARGMEPEHWVLQFVMEKTAERDNRPRDEQFDELVAQLFKDRAPAFEALARSEREEAAMSPEELTLKYPNRR